MTAALFLNKLDQLRDSNEIERMARFFSFEGEESKFFGMKMGSLFKLAKEFAAMPLPEVALLLDDEHYESRMGAVCIMDFQARAKKITADHKKQLFDLYLSKHHRINNWDMVDRAAPFVVGGYLYDQPRGILYDLARSANVWERRTAIVATYYFLRKGETVDTFQIAEILVNDPHNLIRKAVGSWIRHAGNQDRKGLLDFLDRHAATMPRVVLRYAVEKLNSEDKQYYMKLK